MMNEQNGQHRYTLDDLNAAVNNEPAPYGYNADLQQPGDPPQNIWGSISKAATEGPQGVSKQEISQKLAKMNELKMKQKQQFQEKQGKIIGADVQAQTKGNGGMMRLEDMHLDNEDNTEGQNFDPYFNPMMNAAQ